MELRIGTGETKAKCQSWRVNQSHKLRVQPSTEARGEQVLEQSRSRNQKWAGKEQEQGLEQRLGAGKHSCKHGIHPEAADLLWGPGLSAANEGLWPLCQFQGSTAGLISCQAVKLVWEQASS